MARHGRRPPSEGPGTRREAIEGVGNDELAAVRDLARKLRSEAARLIKP